MKNIYKFAQEFQEAVEINGPKNSDRVWLQVADKLLPMMMAASLIHHTNHWNAMGASSFSDHLLHERIYNDSEPLIDALAEKITTALPGVLEAKKLMAIAHQLMPTNSEEDLVNYGLKAEQAVLNELQVTLSVMEKSGQLSPGLSNLLEGIYDKHEEFVYLLQQRTIT